MKKLTALLGILFLLTGCGTSQPVNALKKTQPILNIDYAYSTQLDVSVSEQQAWIENKTQSPLNVQYHLYWYDSNGVSQPEFTKTAILTLKTQERKNLNVTKPSEHSANYRLYIH